MSFRDESGRCNWLNSKEGKCGQGQNRTADTRIFSPAMVPGLCAAIGRQLNEYMRLEALRSRSICRLEHIGANGSGKVAAKLTQPMAGEKMWYYGCLYCEDRSCHCITARIDENTPRRLARGSAGSLPGGLCQYYIRNADPQYSLVS
jgi:hypothetical protein